MIYSLNRVWWQLKYHWKIYSFILLEYAVGIVVLVSCMNIFYSSRDTLKELKNQVTDGAIPVTYTGGRKHMEDSTFPISYDNYLELSERYNRDLSMSFAQYCINSYFVKSQIITLHILFMNKNMFQDVIGYEQKENTVYVGKEAYVGVQTLAYNCNNGKLNENVIPSNQNFFSFANDTIGLSDKVAYDIVLVQQKKGKEYISLNRIMSNSIPIDSCIIFPIDSVQLIRDIPLTVPSSLMTVRYIDNNSEEDKVAALVSDLSMLKKGYQFTVADQYLLTQGIIGDLNAKYETYFLAACAVLVIVITGITGILLIYLYRRKKSMAISLAYGATFGRVVGELLLEVFAILICGCILGIVGAYHYHSHIHLSYTEVHFHPICIFLVIGVTGIGSFLASSLALIGVKKEAPIHILRDL